MAPDDARADVASIFVDHGLLDTYRRTDNHQLGVSLYLGHVVELYRILLGGKRPHALWALLGDEPLYYPAWWDLDAQITLACSDLIEHTPVIARYVGVHCPDRDGMVDAARWAEERLRKLAGEPCASPS